MLFFKKIFAKKKVIETAKNNAHAKFSYWNELVNWYYEDEPHSNITKFIYLDDKTERAVINLRKDGFYNIFFERLYPYDFESFHEYSEFVEGAYWSSYEFSGIFDSVESAEKEIVLRPPFKYNRVYSYENIISTTKELFPELEEYKNTLYIPELLYLLDEEEAYIFFTTLWKLLECALLNKIEDNGLIERIFLFMERMASSEKMVKDLMVIEMIEPLFSLDFDLYDKVIRQYLLPKTHMCLELHKQFFRYPTPN